MSSSLYRMTLDPVVVAYLWKDVTYALDREDICPMRQSYRMWCVLECLRRMNCSFTVVQLLRGLYLASFPETNDFAELSKRIAAEHDEIDDEWREYETLAFWPRQSEKFLMRSAHEEAENLHLLIPPSF